MISEFILIIALYGGDKPFIKVVEGFTSMESCASAAKDFNGFLAKKDARAMAFCIEKK